MGLVQREIEAAGIPTISLSYIPALTEATGVSRMAAIERPSGLNVGQPGDCEGQRAVLRATLHALQTIDTPGGVVTLPYRWEEPAEKVNIHPPQQPPIAQYIVRHPFVLPRFMRRNPPDNNAERGT